MSSTAVQSVPTAASTCNPAAASNHHALTNASVSSSSHGGGGGINNKRRRSTSDEEASFLLEGEDAARVKAAINVSLQREMKRRIGCSLKETCAELEAVYPEDAKDGIEKVRRRATSELSDFVRSREGTPLLGPGQSPTLGVSPTANSPEFRADLPPAVMQLPAAASSASAPLDSTPLAAAHSSPSMPPILPPSTLPPPLTGPAPLEKSPTEAGPDKASLDPSDIAQMYSHDGLLDHEQLLRAIYASQGLDFSSVQGQGQQFLEQMRLRPHDMGVVNTDENGNMLINQCFYLSLARGYLGHSMSWSETSELALRLKRAIEAAVLAERPDWAQDGEVGSEAMAFADFLPLAMKVSSGEQAELNVLAELAVCILDSTAGHVEVYLGSKYKDLPDEGTQERNLVLLWYTPGHYQCLVNNDDEGSKVLMTYELFKEVLTKHGVQYIETLE